MEFIKTIKPGIILYKVNSQIYLLKFKNKYDMCMSFLRYSEWYESTSTIFKGRPFTILDFMEWYSRKFGKGIFTYTGDWSGFNIPTEVIQTIQIAGIEDWNRYDDLMNDVYNCCDKYDEDNKCYLIGVYGKGNAFKHEMAHGIFYTNKEYRKEMLQLIKDLPAQVKKQFCKFLYEIGYAREVHNDEMQAYLSTGLVVDELKDVFDDLDYQKLNKPFVAVFKKHYNV